MIDCTLPIVMAVAQKRSVANEPGRVGGPLVGLVWGGVTGQPEAHKGSSYATI